MYTSRPSSVLTTMVMLLVVSGGLGLACAKPNLDEGGDSANPKPRTQKSGDGSDVTQDELGVAPLPPAAAPAQCDPASCAGCCSGGQCFTDHTADHCAIGGVACLACKAGEACAAYGQSYVCALAPPVLAATYSIILAGASVQNGADGNGDLPDVYVNQGRFGKLNIGRTATIENNLKPSWNKLLGTLPNADVVGAQLTIELKDEDSFGGDDQIGTCSHVVTLAEVVAGKVVVPKADCMNGVDGLELTIKAVP